MLRVTSLEIPEVKIVTPRKFGDARGFLSEVYGVRDWQKAGIVADFVQDNHSVSVRAGTIRGLHFQLPPFAQAKLVRVVRGAVFDVAVDLRRNSPTFGRHASATLSAQDWNQMYIPVGFAHGFCTLEPDTEVMYKVSGYYSGDHDRGVRWDDPALGIKWPAIADLSVLSEKDRGLPLLAELPACF
jgi:dTDP-4-dehydrorhamnose 3,5-epimerase